MNTTDANGGATVTGTPGTEVSEGFSSTAMVRNAETSSVALAAQAKAAIEARYIMAIKRPRDWDAVRLAVLKECRRPGFAAVARYRKPVGEGVEGPSIRFSETAMRLMGNVLCEVTAIYEDPEKRIVRVTVTDLESNVTYPGDVTIEKTVERQQLKDGQVPLRARKNSVGKTTYLVEATEDDLLNKQNALVSKQLRTLANRLIPGDIMEEAMALVVATLEKEDAADPAAARKKLVDGFDRLGVKPSAIRDYLGHDLDAITPAEMAELRAVGITIKEGETTWKDALDHKLKTSKAHVVDSEKPVTLKDKAKAKAAASKATAAAVRPVDVSDADEDGVLPDDDEETDPITGERVPPATGTG